MSEDRHTFSEPRPIPGLELPTWEVDVFRDGVPEPIWTLRVDMDNLPPRKSKKKKVAWKLPDSLDQNPRFGVDEKRRLLDLFKSEKKERRKSTAKQKQGESGSGNEEEVDASQRLPEERNPQNGATNQETKAFLNANESNLQKMSLGPNNSSGIDQSDPTNNQHAKAPPGLDRRHSMPLPPGMGQEATNGSSTAIQENKPPLSGPPPGMYRAQSMPLESPPPPGLSRPSPQQQQQQQQASQATSQPQSATPEESSRPNAPAPQAPPALPIPLMQPTRCFNFSPGMPPDLFAQQACNLYITLLTSGQVDELLLYFTLTAQKSLSLRSAKAVCFTPTEMKQQMTGLIGSVFAVQGVTVQRGLGYLLLVSSGICQLQGQALFFCHTLVLVPVPTTALSPAPGDDNPANGMPQYQIQNDALVLLANE